MDSPNLLIEEYLQDKMWEPVIEAHECPVPGLYHFTAFEEAWACEDPLIPEDFYVMEDGEVHTNLPLKQIRYTPKTGEAALEAGVWFIVREFQYLTIHDTNYVETADGITVTVFADFYLIHPMYGDPPLRNITFTARCKDGTWSLPEPEGPMEDDVSEPES